MITHIKNFLRGFRKPTIYRVIVSWEHDPFSITTDRPRGQALGIAHWCIENAQQEVRFRRYTGEKPVARNILTITDLQNSDALYGNSYSYFRDTTLVEFLDLEFDNEDDLGLFVFVWMGRVKIVPEIPFGRGN